MIERITRHERHIPEDEFHAYFDQALSRSQCAEIETHLSHCASCQDQRAEVALVRDRTTALLAGLSPRPVITPPPFQVVLDRRSRELRFAMWRVRLERVGRWAAGIAAVAGIGWLARTVLDPHRSLPSTPIAEVSAPVRQPAAQVVAVVPQDSTPDLVDDASPAPIPEQTSGRSGSGPSAESRTPPSGPTGGGRGTVPGSVHQLASAVADLGPVTRETSAPPEPAEGAGPGGRDLFNQVWRVVQWEDALRIAGSGLPFIEGMAVVGVLMRPGSPGEHPTVIVTQQDIYGEVFQSIEGPVDRVEEVLRRQPADYKVSERTRTPPDYVEEPGGGLRRTLRIMAIMGRVSVDSLNALARMATIR